MRLAINAYFSLYPDTGQGRYLAEIVKGLTATTDIDLAIYYPLPTKNKVYQTIFEQVIFPLFCLYHQAQIAFIPYFAPSLLSLCPQIVTIHDLIHFRLPRLKFSTGLYKKFLALSLQKAKAVITDSDWSKKEIIEITSYPKEKIKVIPLGVDHKVFRPKKGPKENFFLWVGNDSPHKNLRWLLNFWPNNWELKIVGASFQTNRPKNISYLSPLSDLRLARLYQSATALLVTSSFEGFCLPALEAMSCGCPVIAADIVPLRKLCQKAALYFAPKNTKDLESKIKLLERNPRLATKMATAGKLMAQKYSWGKTIAQTFKVIRDV